jgi:hypothetical protein
MKLGSDLIKPVLDALDQKIMEAGEHRELIVCGGAALLVLNVTQRQTRDVDVLFPKLDPLLIAAAAEIAAKFGLEAAWLNNGPESLSRDLEKGWEGRAQVGYQGRSLCIKTLGRRDLMASKLFALCDRDESDLEDLVCLKPSLAEIDSLKPWVLEREASDLWPERVEKCFNHLKARLSIG